MSKSIQSLTHVQRVRLLYKTCLRLHRGLPTQLQMMLVQRFLICHWKILLANILAKREMLLACAPLPVGTVEAAATGPMGPPHPVERRREGMKRLQTPPQLPIWT